MKSNHQRIPTSKETLDWALSGKAKRYIESGKVKVSYPKEQLSDSEISSFIATKQSKRRAERILGL